VNITLNDSNSPFIVLDLLEKSRWDQDFFSPLYSTPLSCGVPEVPLSDGLKICKTFNSQILHKAIISSLIKHIPEDVSEENV
jgi:hypothetical protein